MSLLLVLWFVDFPLLGNLLPSPTETVAVWLVEFSHGTATKFLKEAVAVSNSNKIGMCLFFL